MTRRIFLFLFAVLTTLGAPAQNKALNHLYNGAAKAAKDGKYAVTDSLYQAYADLFRQEKHTPNFQFSEVLSYLARRAAQKGNVAQGIRLQEEVIEIRKTAPDCNYAQWASAVSDLASFYAQQGKYSKAIEVGTEGVEMLKKKLGEEHHFYNIALANLAGYYSARGETGDYQRAIELGERAVKNMKHGTPEYANALNGLVVFYTQNGQRAEANKLSVKARKEARKRLEEDGVGYAMVLNNNAIRLANAGNYEEAVSYALSSRECFELSGNTQTLSYTKLLTNMATFYSHLQKYKEAAAQLEEALPIIERVTSRQHPDYVNCLSQLSAVYKGMGNMEKADEMAHQSDQMGQQLGQQDNVKYAKSLSKQAATFASNGNYRRAIEREQKAMEIYRQRRDSLSQAFSMGTLASYLFSDGQQQQGIEMANQALGIFRQRGNRSPQWAQALNNTAILYYNHHDYDQAAEYGRQALNMYRELRDTANAIYARIMANNGLFLFMKDSVEQAMQLAQQAIALQTKALGSNHPDNVPLLYNLAVYQIKAKQLEEAEHTYKNALDIQSEQVRTNFLHLTSQDREKFWKRKNYVFRFAPMLAYLDRNRDSMAIEAYNAQLFTKGILLNSDIDFRNLLRRSGDQELLGKYNQLEQLKADRESYYRQPIYERNPQELKTINEAIYQLERTLVKGCKEYGSFTEALSIDAAQVAASLHDDEAAIEFADIYIEGMGTTFLALLLRKDWKQPKLIKLFSEADLRQLKFGPAQQDFYEALKTQGGINSVYNDARLGSMLWRPVMAHLQGISNVYFSPTSMFYQLGIEYLPCDSVHRISDLYSVYRLSSTKSLTQRQPMLKPKQAIVYGGLRYDMTLAQLREQHNHVNDAMRQERLLALNNREKASETDMLRTLDSLSLRGSVNFLQGTQYEAENIAEQLMQHGVKTHVLMGNDGTEETFKAMSGEPYGIIHIATHGFYFSESELQQTGEQLVFLNEQTDNLDNALNYSGLLLSGANYALKGNRIPEDLEDGVLTAREIAQVDLAQAQLVVLSACQTGLGEIRDDGVFGIQRGFKKAGARSLLMSLWKVSDQATDLMMSTFYEQLVSGQPCHRAFREAQQAVRRGGYDDPFFWASFILLDGQ